MKAELRPPSEVIPTEHGEFRRHPIYRDKLVWRKTTTHNPRDRHNRIVLSQEEILDEIVGAYNVRYTGEFPDIIIKERGVVEPLPREVEDMPQFQGAEDIIYYQKASGNFTKKYRRALGMRILEDPYYFTRAGLLENRIIRSVRHPILKKVRSVLRTVNLCTDSAYWGELGKDAITAVEITHVGRRWHWDLGRVMRMIGRSNGTQLTAQIYRLIKRDCFIALEPI